MGLRRWCSHYRDRDRSRWHQSPSSQCPSWHQSPSPSPHNPILLMSSSAAPSKISAYNWDPSNPGAKCNKIMPPYHQRETMKEEAGQVWCGWGVGWQSYISLGPDLLPSGGTAKKWDDTPSSLTPGLMDSPWLPPSKDPQHHPTYIGGA